MKILFVIVVAVIAFVVFVRYFEATAIFHPTKEVAMTPQDLGMDFEDIFFQTKDGLKLNAWFVKAPHSKATLVYFHGNAGNLSHRVEKIRFFHDMGLNVFIIDYRGYGKSEGSPTEQGTYQDADAAYNYLSGRSDIDKSRLIAYGDSLGGVVAVDIARRRPFSCLIVDSSFSSAVDISNTIFPFVPTFLLSIKMDSQSKIKDVTIPKLFIHSINDEIIPFRLGKKLYDSAGEPKRFLQIKGGHNTNHIDSHDLFVNGLTQFLRELKLL